LVWLAAVLALSALIPQAPPNVADPVVRSQWLATVPIKVRPAVERLYSLGIFKLLDTVWLRLPLALLLAHALVALAGWLPALWHRVRQSPDEMRPLGKSFHLERNWPAPVEEVCHGIIDRLEKAGYHIVVSQDEATSDEEQKTFTASRWKWSWLGPAGIYLGLGLASAGLILQGWLGQAQELHLAPDVPTLLPVGASSTPILVLESVTVTGVDRLQPVTGVALVRVSTDVGEGQRLALKLHSSRLLQGMWLTLAELKPMVEVMALDEANGDAVLLQPFSPRTPAQEQARLSLAGDPETRFVGVPSQNVTLHVDYQMDVDEPGLEDRHPGPVFYVSFFRGAEAGPSQSASLKDGEEESFDGVRYQVTFGYDARLRLDSVLWWIATAAGWGLAALSFIVLAVAPPVFVQGEVMPAAEGSRLALSVDVLGDEQQRRQDLQASVTPDT
jgi:hypothetical protein